MKSNKELALKYLKEKEHTGLSYARIAELTGYSISHLKRLKVLLENKDIDSLKNHGGKNNKNRLADEKEINFIIKFKEQYPIISISQFQDIYNEVIIFNKNMTQVVIDNNLKQRSYSFFQMLYKRMKWKTPFKHRVKGKKAISYNKRTNA